jgi:YhcH/YjgK/YiaL family protein
MTAAGTAKGQQGRFFHGLPASTVAQSCGMALFGPLAAIRAQLADPGRFAAALACVEEAARPGTAGHRRLAALAPGATERVELAGGAFALFQAYLTKPRDAGRWETHRAHIDVQTVVEGEEFLEVADRARLVLHEDLTPGQDVIFYHPFGAGSRLRLSDGATAVFFPVDAHMGALAVAAPNLVRKVVVKVPVT